MNQPLNGPLPNPGYLRLFEYQKQRKVYPTYTVDLPLLLFIFFSRIAAGLSILSVFFPPSILWMSSAFCCMVFATGASITHLTIPARFLAMIINHRSPVSGRWLPLYFQFPRRRRSYGLSDSVLP